MEYVITILRKQVLKESRDLTWAITFKDKDAETRQRIRLNDLQDAMNILRKHLTK